MLLFTEAPSRTYPCDPASKVLLCNQHWWVLPTNAGCSHGAFTMQKAQTRQAGRGRPCCRRVRPKVVGSAGTHAQHARSPCRLWHPPPPTTTTPGAPQGRWWPPWWWCRCRRARGERAASDQSNRRGPYLGGICLGCSAAVQGKTGHEHERWLRAACLIRHTLCHKPPVALRVDLCD